MTTTISADTPLPDPPGAASPSNDAFGSLATFLYAADSFEAVCAAIVHAAVRVVDGCHHASIMHRNRDGSFTTAAATDDVAKTVDALERQLREGPCLDAILEDDPQVEHDLAATDTRWPALAREVLSRTPVRSAAGFRIVSGNRKIGALNLFSDVEDGIDGASVDQAIILAAFASVAVGALDAREEARTLSAGLESNREIGKAIGLMMAFHKVSDAEAFELLRKASQDMNIKLAEVAREVVEHHNTGHPSGGRR